jgi:hypothetical protein
MMRTSPLLALLRVTFATDFAAGEFRRSGHRQIHYQQNDAADQRIGYSVNRAGAA